MWSLAGDELTGSYGRWNDRTYELYDRTDEGVTLAISSDAEPAPGWARRTPDAFWAEGCRWELRVPAEEVSDVRSVVVETPIYGQVFTVHAQREDGCWAVSSDGDLDPAMAERLGLTRDGGGWAGWVPADQVVDFIHPPSAETATPV